MPAQEPYLEEVAEGVHAYIQLDGGWYLNNCGFVVGSDGVVCIDATSTEQRTKAYLAAMRGVTDLPVRVLLNTHHHGDHNHGNYLFPTTAIVAHETCRRETIEAGLIGQALFPDVEWGAIEVKAPFVTFRDRITVWADNVGIECVHVGPAHTTNDVYAWIPSRGVLFSGDLVFHQVTPLALQGTISGWLAALAELKALEPRIVVPGHGPVGGPEALDQVERYLRFVQDLASAAHADGRTALEAAQGADLGEFAEWPDSERLVMNLHRAMSELRGEPAAVPLDIGAVIGDTVTYNGGAMPHSDA